MILRVTSDIPRAYLVYSEWNGANTPGPKEEIFTRQTERFSAGVELHAGIFSPLEKQVKSNIGIDGALSPVRGLCLFTSSTGEASLQKFVYREHGSTEVRIVILRPWRLDGW
ncbi:hypothetical protein QLX08_007035 [Tetragonisca angustula]|uniref:Uncharacterized protein n=1 Tax=Tetragonisca angustula TaxID=166442 RepID=A0AAW0ZRT0_9HYME